MESITEDFIKEFETSFIGREGYSCVVKSNDKVIQKHSLSENPVSQRTFGAGLEIWKLNLTIKWEKCRKSSYTAGSFYQICFGKIKKKQNFLSTGYNSLLSQFLVHKMLNFLPISLTCHFSYLMLPLYD